VGLDNRFYLIVRAADGSWEKISSARYFKEEALRLAEGFVGLNTSHAQKLWAVRKL